MKTKARKRQSAAPILTAVPAGYIQLWQVISVQADGQPQKVISPALERATAEAVCETYSWGEKYTGLHAELRPVLVPDTTATTGDHTGWQVITIRPDGTEAVTIPCAHEEFAKGYCRGIARFKVRCEARPFPIPCLAKGGAVV